MNVEFLSYAQSITSESLTDKVYNLLEGSIINMRFRPGDVLNEADIANAFNVSRSPVREALLRLEYEGLVIKSRKCRTVSNINEDTVINNYHMWEMTEAYAVGYACQYATQKDIDIIEETLHKMERYKEEKNMVSYRELNHSFHSLLVAPCPFTNIVECHRNALNHIKWGYNYTLIDLQNINFSRGQHMVIFNAYVKKDKPVLEKEIRDHINDASIRMRAYLKKRHL